MTSPTAQSEMPDEVYLSERCGIMLLEERKHMPELKLTKYIRADLAPTVTPLDHDMQDLMRLAQQKRFENTNASTIDPDMPADQLRLHMGELTADEVRVARAAIRLANSMGSAPKSAVTPDAAREALQGFNSLVRFPIQDGDAMQQLAHAEKVTRIRRTISDVLLSAWKGG